MFEVLFFIRQSDIELSQVVRHQAGNETLYSFLTIKIYLENLSKFKLKRGSHDISIHNFVNTSQYVTTSQEVINTRSRWSIAVLPAVCRPSACPVARTKIEQLQHWCLLCLDFIGATSYYYYYHYYY